MNAAALFRPAVVVWFLLMASAGTCWAQDAPAAGAAPEVQLPEISDEPKTTDPTTFMPEPLRKRATCDLSDSSLAELVEWLRGEGLVVLLDKQGLSNIGLLPSEPVSDRLENDPIYYLLNRLQTLNLEWYLRNGIIHIAPPEEAEMQTTTVTHNVGDLLDTGCDMDELIDLIECTVAPSTWDTVGGQGILSSLGDVLFVCHTDQTHREVQGLLAALRKHGRMTFTLDPPEHIAIREKLEQPVSVEFRDTPLEDAVAAFAKKSGVDIRLDRPTLRNLRIREREPVSLTLNDCKAKTVLHAMLMDLNLAWHLSDRVVWVTSHEEAESSEKTAVYDVRDLCRNEGESDALGDAVTSQAAPETWDDVGGSGSVQFAQPGTMVVYQTEPVLFEVLDLLETYRTALRQSKPRDRNAIDPQEVITVYYRMPAGMAADLAFMLPELAAADSWHDTTHPDAPGKIVRVTSSPELFAGAGSKAGADQDPSAFVVQQEVLVITQTRAAHDEVAKVIDRVKNGDPPAGFGGMGSAGQKMMGGMGGGTFGGGYFCLPDPQPTEEK